MAGARPGLTVFTYHRIADPASDSYYDPVISATAEGFRAQVQEIARRFRVLTLDEAIDRLRSGDHADRSALITFDDGYRDNFETAAPILRELGLPAAFFLPTGFLDEPSLPWWDEVAWIVKHAPARRWEISLSAGAAPLAIDLIDGPRSEAIRALIAAILAETVKDVKSFLATLADRSGVAPDSTAMGRALFTDWDQVRTLTGPATGLAIGSHGRTHRKLATLDDEAQLDELAGSRGVLRDRLGRDVDAIAYPYGWPGAFSELTKTLAARAGYRVGFAAIEGINRPGSTDPFAVRRLNVGSGDSPTLLRARSALHATLGRSFL